MNRAQSQKPNQNNQKIQRFLPNQKLADSITANSLTKIIHTHTHTHSHRAKISSKLNVSNFKLDFNVANEVNKKLK